MKKNKNSEGEVPRSKRTYLWALRMALLTFLIAAVFAFVADVISRGESFGAADHYFGNSDLFRMPF